MSRVAITIEEGMKSVGMASDIPLSNLRRRCPATILAVKRTERVIGRIRFLMVSIKTIKNDSPIGVPSGTR
jgi:hypothetical protein